MADAADIILALIARVETLDCDLPISWPEPETTFIPPTDGKYLEVTFAPNRPKWRGLASGRIDQGLMQIAVVWPPRKGIAAPARIVDAIKAHFAYTTAMTYGTATVRVSDQPWQVSPISEASKVRTPVMIPWTAT